MTGAGPEMTRRSRLDRHARVDSALAGLGDRELGEIVGAARVLGSGIGGTRARLDVAGVPVFVKRVPLTELERQPGNVRSTANLCDLPTGCQYGVASPGISVWRELAANEIATRQIVDGHAGWFPLLHHWRVVDRPAWSRLPDELAGAGPAVARWHGSAPVGRRIGEIARSATSVALFLEWLPETVQGWLSRQVAAGEVAAARAVAMVERRLVADVPAMNAAGLFHFDAHLDNILTDGDRLYFCDLALAMSPAFQLSPAESRFLDANRTHDRCHTITRLVDWLVTTFAGAPDWQVRNDIIERVAAGRALAGVPGFAAEVIERHAPVAAVINDFYRQLHLVDPLTPYPVDAVRDACAAAGAHLLSPRATDPSRLRR